MSKPSDKDKSLDNPEIGYAQAIQYGKDLARMYKAEKEEREKYETLFNLSPDGVMIVGEDGIIQTSNPALRDILDVTDDAELEGKNLSSLIAPENAEACLDAINTIFADKASPETLETVFVRSQGSVFPVEINFGHVIWEDQSAAQIIVRDITERKQAMELLENRVAERTQELSVMYTVSSVGNKTQDIMVSLEQSLEILLHAIKAPAGLIFVHKDIEGEKEITAVYGILPDDLNVIENWYGKEKIYEQVVLKKKYISNSNLSLEEIDCQSYVAIPIWAEEDCIGTLIIFRADRHDFSEEMKLCKSIADQIGILIHSNYLRGRLEQAVIVEERHRLARELHDSITQLLYSLTLFATAGIKFSKSNEWSRVEQYLDRLNETAKQAVKEMRLLIFELRPSKTEVLDLVSIIQNRLNSVESRAGIKTSLSAKKWKPSPDENFHDLYRIIQEALNNSLKHAKAKHVWIDMISDGEKTEVKIKDDGIGFNHNKSEASGGMGLENMKERSRIMGGSLIIETKANKGTTIMISINKSSNK